MGRFLVISAISALSASTAVCGCASAEREPRTFPPPIVEAKASSWFGHPISGPTDFVHETGAEGKRFLVRARLIAIDALALRATEGRSSSPALHPLASSTRLLFAPQSGQGLLAVPRLSRGSQVAIGRAAEELVLEIDTGAFGPVALAAALEGELGPERTVELAFEGSAPKGAPAIAFAATYSPDSSSIEVSLTFRGEVAIAREASTAGNSLAANDSSSSISKAPSAPASHEPWEETVVLDPLPVSAAGARLAIVFPNLFSHGRDLPLDLVLDADLSPAESTRAPESTPTATEAAVARSASTVRAVPVALPSSASPVRDPLVLEGALAALDVPHARRRTLLYLASATGAALALDLALAADDDLIADIAARVRETPSEASLENEARSETRDLGWTIDRSAVAAVLPRLSSDALAPGLAAILALHTGEVGRHASALEEAAQASADLAAFGERLVTENRLFLEDASPGARARALEWLESRGLAPAGFDPLASARERRLALDRAASNAPTTGGQESP